MTNTTGFRCCLGTLLACCAFAVTTAQGASTGSFDAAAFAALPQADRFKFVVAALNARDMTLQNITYKTRESSTNVRLSDGSRRFLRTENYEFRRLGEKIWLKKYADGPGGTAVEYIGNWDGHVGRGVLYPPYAHAAYAKCRITPKENPNFAFRVGNELLGLRAQVPPGTMCVREWLEIAAAHGFTIEVSIAELKSHPALKFVVTEGQDVHTVWLDPDHDFMVTQFDYLFQVADKYTKAFDEVLATENVSGVWIPTRAIRRSGTSASPEETQITVDVEDFRTGTVSERDLDVSFPEGGAVIDETLGIAYFVRPKAEYELVPLANSKAGILRSPPQEKVLTDHVDKATAATYVEKPIAIVPLEGPRQSALRWPAARIAALACSVLAVAGSIFFLARRRCRRAAARNG